MYASGTPGFGLLVSTWFTYRADHQRTIDDYYADAAAGTLPAVTFVDPHLGAEAYNQDDEHPPTSPQPGQQFVAKMIDALTKSPAWSSSALFLTYDEQGGLWDHVPPPPCARPATRRPSSRPASRPEASIATGSACAGTDARRCARCRGSIPRRDGRDRVHAEPARLIAPWALPLLAALAMGGRAGAGQRSGQRSKFRRGGAGPPGS